MNDRTDSPMVSENPDVATLVRETTLLQSGFCHKASNRLEAAT